MTAELDQFPPAEKREELLKEKRAKLTEAELKIEALAPLDRTQEQYMTMMDVQRKLQIRPGELADRVEASQRAAGAEDCRAARAG